MPSFHLRTFDSLGIRDYRLLWLGQLTVGMAQWMDQVTRTWLIYDLTRSPIQLGLVNAVQGIPLLVFGMVAGVVADRYGRKAQLVIAQSVNAVLNVVLALLVLTGLVEPWHVYVTGFLAGTVQAFQQPARQALVSDLVGRKKLLNAISLNSAARNLTNGLGATLGGILIQAWGVDYAYFTQAAFYVLATVWTVQINVPPSVAIVADSVTQQSFFASAKEGFAYIASHRLILVLMTLGLGPVVVGMPYRSLLPIFAVDVFHGGAEAQGTLLTAQGMGALVGALAIASLGQGQGNGKLLIGGALGFGVALILFSQAPVLWLALAFTFLAGLFQIAYRSQDQTIIQVMVPRELRGRVLGIYLLDRGLMPLGSLLAGVLASFIGGPWAVTIMGVSCALMALAIALFMPALRRLNLMMD